MQIDRKRYLLLFLVLSLIFFGGIFYVRWPMSKGDVLKEVNREDDGEFSDYKAKEYPVKNLHEKMGLQLFRVTRKLSDTGKFGGEVFFLVNRLQSRWIFGYDTKGDFACIDYDNDGKYEFLYLYSSYPALSGLNDSALYIYGMPDGRIQLERVYLLMNGEYPSTEHYLFKANKDNTLYLINEYDDESVMQIMYQDGKWLILGKGFKTYRFEDVTREQKESIDQTPFKSLHDF